MWWWDGAQWRPAISPDGMWRWDGRGWQPTQAYAPRRGGGGTAVVVTVAAFAGVILLVSLFTLVVLLTMGNQIANVFSNVVAALNGS